MNGYIYKFTNKINGKVYIGQTRQKLKTRYNQHINNVKKDKYPIHAAIQKYGAENFEFSTVEEIVLEDKQKLIDTLNKLEIKYIKEYNSLCPNGYNIQKGGTAHDVVGVKRSETTIINHIVRLPKIYNSNVKPRDLLVYLSIQLFSINSVSNVSLKTLSEITTLSIPTLRKIIPELEKHQLIKIEGNQSNKIYTIISDTNGESFSSYFILNDNLSTTTKAYLIATQQWMFKDIEGLGKLSYSNVALSKQINMPESSIRKCNKELERKNYLTILKNKSRDLETGCKTDTKIFNLNELGQAIIWTLKNHEDRITQNTEDINFLKQQLQSQQELILKLLENKEQSEKKFTL